MRLLITMTLISFLFASEIFAETKDEKEKPSLGKGTIESQFDYVIKESQKYDEYKMVKSWWLTKLKDQVLDSLKNIQKKFVNTKNLSSLKSSRIDSLNSTLASVNLELNTINREKESMSLFGMVMNKKAYNSLMWTAITSLFFLMIMFFVMYKRSNIITLKTKKEHEEAKDEIEKNRRRALEREQKIVRQLHDEINKYKRQVDAQ